ncbi:hypothetical protein TRM7557_01771 [Tritonibacter multivorans]|uniref:Uncharacterized protein n=1 Tax=Tritonibacter multivorans TaxID=928856 RepID=A0A0N7LZP1_9RHOB|nr:hypothetical protein TRM7557_01771 [Tritonibacter multivorans]SFD63056.1 hypothetical protein SAMN04488049_11862 [Tritonibacter multivorans]
MSPNRTSTGAKMTRTDTALSPQLDQTRIMRTKLPLHSKWRRGAVTLRETFKLTLSALLLLRRCPGDFRHSTCQLLVNNVRFIGLHFLPSCAFLTCATAAKTPATGPSKFANIDAGTFTLFHVREPIVRERKVDEADGSNSVPQKGCGTDVDLKSNQHNAKPYQSRRRQNGL